MSASNHMLKRVTAVVMAIAMVLTTVFASNPLAVQAASKKVVTKIKVASKSVTLTEGSSKTVKVTVKAKKGANKKFTVKSKNKGVATVKVSGKAVKITGKKAGTAIITVTTKGKNKKGKKLSAKIKVTVTGTTPETTSTEGTTVPATTQAGDNNQVVATDLTLVADKKSIQIGSPAIVTATVAPANVTDKTVTFTSSNTAIATVDANTGVVLGISEGTVVISATTANGISRSVAIEVTPVYVTGIEIDQTEAEISIPGTLSLKASVVPANASNQKITWVSQDQKIATVDEVGRVTAVAEGTTVITATTADGNHTATCKVTVKKERVVADGISLEVTNATEINGTKYENTQLVGHDMTFLVTVGKNGQPVVGDNIQVSTSAIAGNMRGYYTVRENSIKTDENGHATFTIGLTNQHADLNAVQKYFQSLAVTVKESDANLSTKSTVKFASIALNGIDVLRTEPYNTILEPGQNAADSDNGLFPTKSQNGAQSQTYVNSQQVSSTDQNHKVYMSAAPYLLLPASEEAEVRSEWEYKVPVGQQGGKCSVYNDQTNTATTVTVADIPAGLEYLTLDFDKFELSKYTTLQITMYDKFGNIIGKPETRTSDNNGTPSIQIKNLNQNEESYMVVSLISQGQVDTASAGYALTKISGPYASVSREMSEAVEIPGAVTWEDISKVAINRAEIKTLTYDEASALIPSDSQFLSEDYTYKYQVPVFPISGNAILIVCNKNGEEKAYFSFPAENLGDNINQLASDSKSKKAIQITTGEKNNTAGTLTTDGNVAVLDSQTTGMQFVKATIKIDALSDDELNKWNGGELYSFVHWAPLPKKEEEAVENPVYFAIEGQEIVVTAQLVDGNMNPQATEGDQITVKYGDPDNQKEIDLTSANKAVGNDATFVSVSNNGATDQDGKVTIKFRDITNNDFYSAIKGLVVESEKFDVALSIATEDGTSSKLIDGAIDLHWVDLGLTFVNSAVEKDAPVRTINFIDQEVNIDAPANYIVSDKNGWQIGYQPIARSSKFIYVNDDDEWIRRSDQNKGVFVSVSGVKVEYEKSGDMSLDTSKDGLAIVSSTTAGTYKLTGNLSIPDPSKVTFTYYDKNGELVTAKNIGTGSVNSTSHTGLTLSTVWEPDGMNVDVIAPSYVNEKETANVYVKITDNYGNPLDGKTVTYTIAGVNAVTTKKAATASKDGKGVYVISLPVPTDISAGDSSIVVYVTDKEAKSVKVTYVAAQDTAFDIIKETSDAKPYKVSKDGKTIEVFFTNRVEETSISAKMFKLVNPADKSEIKVESATKGEAKSIVLTLSKEIPDTSLKQNLVISPANDEGVITWLSDTSGQFLKSKTVSFIPENYTK